VARSSGANVALCRTNSWADQVDQLASGGEFRLHRWELPADHPSRFEGSLQDDLVLGVDNTLRLA
jgi:hypothetical protein